MSTENKMTTAALSSQNNTITKFSRVNRLRRVIFHYFQCFKNSHILNLTMLCRSYDKSISIFFLNYIYQKTKSK